MEKVDVIINVYGKPWQTLCSLKSLMKVSGEHIDKIYFIEESKQPYNDTVDWLTTEFDNLIYYKPNKYVFTPITNSFGDLYIPENRYNFRYQYGLEKSDKKYCFILHNDILFTGDIIGDMLNEINDCAGIGLLGQCWNCPAFSANLCNGDKIQGFKPTYAEVIKLCSEFKPARGSQFINLIDKNKPIPLPECRLNEFACLINKNICINECPPNGNTPYFGSYDILDLGDAWFRSLWLKGYKFKNYDINRTSIHGYYSQINNDVRIYNSEIKEEKYIESKMFVSGYPTQLDQQKYIDSEIIAKKYYEENFIKK